MRKRVEINSGAKSVSKYSVTQARHESDQLAHLHGVLERSDPMNQDVVLVTVEPGNAADVDQSDDLEQVVGDWEVRVFTTTAAVAEDAGKLVILVRLVGDRPYGTVLQAAQSLRSSSVVVGALEQSIAWQTEEILSGSRQTAGMAE